MNVYWKRHVWPFDKTKRSLLKYLGLLGEYFMAYFQSETPMAAIPMAPIKLRQSCIKILGMFDQWLTTRVATLELLA